MEFQNKSRPTGELFILELLASSSLVNHLEFHHVCLLLSNTTTCKLQYPFILSFIEMNDKSRPIGELFIPDLLACSSLMNHCEFHNVFLLLFNSTTSKLTRRLHYPASLAV